MEPVVADAEVGDAHFGQRPQPILGDLVGCCPIAIGDDADFETPVAGQTNALDQQGIGEERLTAFEIDAVDGSQFLGLVEHLDHLLAGEGSPGLGPAIEKAVVALEIAGVGEEQVNFSQHCDTGALAPPCFLSVQITKSINTPPTGPVVDLHQAVTAPPERRVNGARPG